MWHPTPLSLVPGSWDDLVARAALKVVDWVHDRLSRRVPTLASTPLPRDPLARLRELIGRTRVQDRNVDDRAERDRQ